MADGLQSLICAQEFAGMEVEREEGSQSTGFHNAVGSQLLTVHCVWYLYYDSQFIERVKRYCFQIYIM